MRKGEGEPGVGDKAISRCLTLGLYSYLCERGDLGLGMRLNHKSASFNQSRPLTTYIMATPPEPEPPEGKTTLKPKPVTLTNWKRVANVPTGICSGSTAQAVHWCDYVVFLCQGVVTAIIMPYTSTCDGDQSF